ncbi:hypothetical protein DSO57_1029874 [Entomophthora muscae]|uniref:Uncharacterized protein n=1 Tax=Entomophthora muscae TaxID=34485 RepID=A0ACC2TZA6_9FUNG|nr:hypothetical protein DSO57_1029874 [Entomophthora muscae]
MHGKFNDQVIPLLFFLLPGAKTEVYTRAFKTIWDALNSLPTNQLLPPTHATRANPSSVNKNEATIATEQLAHVRLLGPKVIIVDFMLAQSRAFEATFNGEVQGFSSILGRPSSKISRDRRSFLTRKCQFAITQFAALAFVRLENIGIGFEALLEDACIKKHSTIFKGYLNYFKKQWVAKKVTARRGKSHYDTFRISLHSQKQKRNISHMSERHSIDF